eukprot:3165619-Amphidinium_carterae.1
MSSNFSELYLQLNHRLRFDLCPHGRGVIVVGCANAPKFPQGCLLSSSPMMRTAVFSCGITRSPKRIRGMGNSCATSQHQQREASTFIPTCLCKTYAALQSYAEHLSNDVALREV